MGHMSSVYGHFYVSCWRTLRSHISPTAATFVVPESCSPPQQKSQEQLSMDQLDHLKSVSVPKVDEHTLWLTYVICSAPGTRDSYFTQKHTDPKMEVSGSQNGSSGLKKSF